MKDEVIDELLEKKKNFIEKQKELEIKHEENRKTFLERLNKLAEISIYITTEFSN